MNGRLYLVEESQELYEDEDESEPHDPLRGRRIFVLTSEGEKLVRVGIRVTVGLVANPNPTLTLTLTLTLTRREAGGLPTSRRGLLLRRHDRAF